MDALKPVCHHDHRHQMMTSPLVEVGVPELNRNPEFSFAEIEQAPFSPSNVVPGISYLQSRPFAYADAHRYRVSNDDDRQPGDLFCLMNPEQRRLRLFLNMADVMQGVSRFIIDQQLDHIRLVDPTYGASVAGAIKRIHTAPASAPSTAADVGPARATGLIQGRTSPGPG
jgi:catalase